MVSHVVHSFSSQVISSVEFFDVPSSNKSDPNEEFFVKDKMVNNWYTQEDHPSEYPLVRVHGTVPKRWVDRVNTGLIETINW